MYEQEKVQKARLVAYIVGIAFFAAVVAWKFLVH
jgi:hypothetical protein